MDNEGLSLVPVPSTGHKPPVQKDFYTSYIIISWHNTAGELTLLEVTTIMMETWAVASGGLEDF